MCILGLRQRSDESLNSFLNRFDDQITQIKNLNLALALHDIVSNLMLNPFLDYVAKKPIGTLDEL